MAEETKLNNSCDDGTTTTLPVDRRWIDKLLKKYPNPNSRITDKALVVAPMVDQSDLPFRLLCRRYGANLCFTPMIHSRLFVESPQYREKFMIRVVEADRPLIAQVCGHDPEIVLKAVKQLEPYVDGIDINCGCPQGIARRGNYGAYLLEKEDVLLRLVRHLIPRLTVPLSIKVRLLPGPDEVPGVENDFDIPKASLALYGKLVDAGIHLLTIHGRTRKQKQDLTGHADWDTIKKAVELFGDRIPIFANGSIQDFNDVEECLKITGADGVMSSESLLEFPPIFYKVPQAPVRTVGRLQLAREYLELAKEYHPGNKGQGSKGVKTIRTHLHRFLHADMQQDFSLREMLTSATSNTIEGIELALEACQKAHKENDHLVSNESLSWYVRHRNPKRKLEELEEQPACDDNTEDEAACISLLFDGSADGDY